MIMTNLIFYTITADNVRAQKITDLRHSLEKGKEAYRKALESIVGISSMLYTDSELSDALDHHYDSTNEMLSVYDSVVKNAITRYVSLNKQFYNATLYTDNETLISSGVLKLIDMHTVQEEWYQEVQSVQVIGELLLYSNFPASGKAGIGSRAAWDQPYLSIIRKLDFFRKSGSHMKLLKIDILPQFAEETLRDIFPLGELYLTGRAGEVLYASNGLPGTLAHRMSDSHNVSLVSSFDNVNYLNGWKLIGIYPRKQIDSAMQQSRLSFVYLTIANLILPSLIIMVLSRTLNARIVLLWKQMKQVKNQHFDLPEMEQANDEIGQLTGEFNRMTAQISLLIRDVYEAELGRRQAQLNALQSQINPHFLFNTLETIRMNSLMKGEQETALVINRLARSFRRSITWGSDTVPIREELSFIEDFLAIQKFRFEDRLEYRFDMEPSIMDVQIPKMSVLPIVENACIHGIERLEGSGLIEVIGTRDAAAVQIVIRDNGVGMSDEKLNDVTGAMRKDVLNQGQHIGIRNVYNRLKLYYQRNFELIYHSAPDRGTVVTMVFPVEKQV
ncbi:sensor histidine kinase [Paenibacillus tarimensis]|nr:sensor histidine kinase [Paenibacillus tarimensis]